MRTTRIGAENRAYFDKMLFKAADFNTPNVLKLGAIENDTACGAAAFQMTEDKAELMSIYVAKDYRRQGIATEFISTFEKLAKGTEVKALIANYLPTDIGLMEFFVNNGFLLTDGSPVYSFKFSDITGSETLKKHLSRGDYSRCYACVDLPAFQQRELRDFLLAHNFTVADMLAMKFSPTLSSVSLDAHNNIQSCLLCSNFGSSVGIDMLLSDCESADSVLVLFRRLFDTLSQQKVQNIELFYLAANKKIIPFAEALLGSSVRFRSGETCAIKKL